MDEEIQLLGLDCLYSILLLTIGRVKTWHFVNTRNEKSRKK